MFDSCRELCDCRANRASLRRDGRGGGGLRRRNGGRTGSGSVRSGSLRCGSPPVPVPPRFGSLQIQAIEQHGEFFRPHRDAVVFRVRVRADWPAKAALLDPLGANPQSAAIPHQRLESGSRAIREEKQVAAHRIVPQMIANQAVQAVKPVKTPLRMSAWAATLPKPRWGHPLRRFQRFSRLSAPSAATFSGTAPPSAPQTTPPQTACRHTYISVVRSIAPALPPGHATPPRLPVQRPSPERPYPGFRSGPSPPANVLLHSTRCTLPATAPFLPGTDFIPRNAIPSKSGSPTLDRNGIAPARGAPSGPFEC
jgi:hypothetical protein